ncbi:MAG TPA: phage holin family protein [Gemmatimonadaceae bacterium]|nr:phage holin family protein [Gemmatimonadaceae bacterium]
MEESSGRIRGFASLFRDLADASAELLRGEIRLARMEFGEIAGHVARGGAQVALGAVLLLLGGLSLATGVVLLVGDQWLPKDRYWLAAFVVMGIAGAFTAWLAKRGSAQLSPSNLAPEQSIESLREDKEWLKQQLTSGATSN